MILGLSLSLAAGASISIGAPAASMADFLTEAEALALFFPGSDLIERKVVLVPEPGSIKLRDGKTPRHYFRHTAWAKGKLLGYAVVDDVMGKARPITYMTATNAKCEVLGIEVLVYRESHGGEIDRPAFRDQFKGRNQDDSLRLGGQIRNISGATISCRAITNGVADVLTLLAATQVAIVAPAAKTGVPSAAVDARHLKRVRVLMNAPLAIGLDLSQAGLTRDQAIAATEATFARVSHLEGILSAFKADSDPTRLRDAAAKGTGETVAIQYETWQLLVTSLEVARQSGGATSPLVGPLLRLLGQAPDASEAARLAAAKLCSSHLVELKVPAIRSHPVGGPPPAPQARLLRAGMSIDFGASGKGFALDQALAHLQAEGAKAGSLDFGGQWLLFGSASIEVELPSGAAAIPDVVKLLGGSLATCGDEERGSIQKGRSHLVDPRTGADLIPHGAVTVSAPTALQADLWSSALYVLGEKEGLALANKLGIAARFERKLQPALTSIAWKLTPMSASK